MQRDSFGHPGLIVALFIGQFKASSPDLTLNGHLYNCLELGTEKLKIYPGFRV